MRLSIHSVAAAHFDNFFLFSVNFIFVVIAKKDIKKIYLKSMSDGYGVKS